MEVRIEIKDFTLKKDKFILKNINLKVHNQEIFSIIGKTGSGKTLLLESITGAYAGDRGNITISGENVLSVPENQRGIGIVYQDYGLFPHMTVYQNISYGLKRTKMPKNVIKVKVETLAEILSIQNILECYPGTISGGECQRTALARALIVNPQILLLDEPFSALDPTTKNAMYDLLMDIHKNFSCTILFVTHDFQESIYLSDRIGVMIDGELVSVRNKNDLFQPYEDCRINKFLGIK